jgi:hypothetical protein
MTLLLLGFIRGFLLVSFTDADPAQVATDVANSGNASIGPALGLVTGFITLLGDGFIMLSGGSLGLCIGLTLSPLVALWIEKLMSERTSQVESVID